MKPSMRNEAAKKTKPQADTATPFDSVIKAMEKVRGVIPTKMFGSVGLKFNGKVFAMVVKEKLVVKLPKERVDALIAAGNGEYFDPGHGRLMKEWIAVEPSKKISWLELSKEAKEFIGSLR
ncbi:MAG: TfoX/Sxy family protein [Ignavibacteriales bacterium]|nr:TfoX/Sxy family protein [Ignavibacteriales bacterium]